MAAAGSSQEAASAAAQRVPADALHAAAAGTPQSTRQTSKSADAVQQHTPMADTAAKAAAPLNGDRSAGELHGPDAFSARAAAASHCTEPNVSEAELSSSHQLDAAAFAATATPAASSAAGPGAAPQPADGQAACSSADQTAAAEAGAEAGGRQREPARHYWGQALQHLDRAAEVEAGSRLTLLAKRDGSTVRFSLRVGFSVNAGPIRRSACAANGRFVSSLFL